MKKYLLTLTAIAALVAGCSDKNIDTAKVRAGLSSLDAGQKAGLEQALTAIEAGHYSDAVQPLKKIAFTAKLDKDQAKLLRDTMTKVEARVAKGN